MWTCATFAFGRNTPEVASEATLFNPSSQNNWSTAPPAIIHQPCPPVRKRRCPFQNKSASNERAPSIRSNAPVRKRRHQDNKADYDLSAASNRIHRDGHGTRTRHVRACDSAHQRLGGADVFPRQHNRRVRPTLSDTCTEPRRLFFGRRRRESSGLI